ncbi:5-bromo-4-chloroindolyl phosphate hydrolysis family protein [Paenibacillus tarimensis]|uniref:5-bromo-4-chloroindolyl phosphate hydrolysis family protein n=1 Tax=Paenibacillus tarimensis TaxID=416012 RepID=UPI001F2BC0D2|nr:5-bromo-4-chloroindolyl phosphate hydrolysis family protein [Paenibacillus tarimensis]MCF2943508.1 5-bromo-4-chloroindolyl phosphate hydrolysis family protein [Paenibacillus tarimensis]
MAALGTPAVFLLLAGYLIFLLWTSLSGSRGHSRKMDKEFAGTASSPRPEASEDQNRREDHPLYKQAVQAAAEAENQVAAIRQMADGLAEPAAVDRLHRLCRIADSIISETRDYPGLLPVAKRFYSFDLPTALRLCSHYSRLIHSHYYNQEMEYMVKRIEYMLEAMNKRFVKRLNRMLHQDLIRLDLELSTIEHTLHSDGDRTTFARLNI